MRYFNIIDRDDHMIVVAECEIEDLQNSFISQEDLTDKYICGWSYKAVGNNVSNEHQQCWYNMASIREAINEWIQAFQPDGISCTKYPASLYRLLRYEPSRFVVNELAPDGYHVGTDRITNTHKKMLAQNANIQERKAAEEAALQAKRDLPYERGNEVDHRDRHIFRRAAQYAIYTKYDIHLRLNTGCMKSYNFIKRNLAWPELKRAANLVIEDKKIKQDLPFLKQLWDQPQLFTTYL